MRGHKTFDEWVEIFEKKSNSTYELSPDERVVFDPMYGFFSYWFNSESLNIIIPKMCGDIKYWYPKITKLYFATKHLGTKGVLFCTKRNPYAFMRLACSAVGELQPAEAERDGARCNRQLCGAIS